jgi:hypothetical protein
VGDKGREGFGKVIEVPNQVPVSSEPGERALDYTATLVLRRGAGGGRDEKACLRMPSASRSPRGPALGAHLGPPGADRREGYRNHVSLVWVLGLPPRSLL